MLRVDAAITKKYWGPLYQVLFKLFEAGEFEKLPGKPFYKVAWRKKLFYVYGKQRGRELHIIGWLFLGQKRGWSCWEVEQSFVFKEYRGKGEGKKLYHAAIEDGILLSSGTQQSVDGRRMWKSLIKSDKYTIWAHDFRDLDTYGPVVYDKVSDEIWSPVDIYENIFVDEKGPYYLPGTGDVRLIAQRKKK